MIFQNDDDLYRPRRTPWGTLLLSAFCAALALAVVFGIRARLRKSDGAKEPVEPPSSEAWQPGTSLPVPATGDADQRQVSGGGTAAQPQSATTGTDTRRPVPPPRPMEVPEGGFVAQRKALLAQLASATPETRPAIEENLGAVNVALATTAVPSPTKVAHVVADGDTLGRLANRYVCPITLIKKINNLPGDSIRSGRTLYILDHPKFEFFVSKGSNTMLVTLNGEFFKRYPVSVGEGGKTPSGTFEITEKEENPTWYPAGRAPIPFGQPGNILGSRWMRLEATGHTARVAGIGIHGTTDPSSIGRATSDGCIRMRNEDVEEIFLMIPLNPHVPVTIAD